MPPVKEGEGESTTNLLPRTPSLCHALHTCSSPSLSLSPLPHSLTTTVSTYDYQMQGSVEVWRRGCEEEGVVRTCPMLGARKCECGVDVHQWHIQQAAWKGTSPHFLFKLPSL